ncbi:CapA family protein [Xylanimonas ulmi]|uniref:Poly-gamma-glutamate synthesis protein (Capsule biosynthesis protein) n=1 Tax=Xylanimonas ulmi TaxID=228973 RepID=A0A4Q7M1P8_9MICO|nr:CapA family protein [Xylanibacterium ulmi]RZS61344.1 poly-gamma-glutamate synthesis protein (capsule biosynthesis protein) [Xylanibacterium ulmi]
MTRTRRGARRPRYGLAAGLVAGGLAAGALTGAVTGHLQADRSADAAGGAPGAAAPTAPAAQEPTTPPPPSPEPAVFTLLAGGDVLLHAPVTRSATHDGVLDYSAVLSGLDAWVQGADLALCHFETPVAPPGQQVTTYPVFGVPAQIVTDLAEQGWDGCSTASNHSVDRALPGLVATLDAFDAAGLGHAGTARTQAEADAPQLYTLEREGRALTVAHLSITYGLNGLPMPADAPWAVHLIDVEATLAQAAAARGAGADLVVVSLHDGVEYRAEPTQDQIAVSSALADSGLIDLVIGHHAHVPQPIVRLDGGPGGVGMWVAYGLGNMVSNQSVDCCTAASSNGVLMTATVVAQPDGPARVTGVEWTATTVDRAAGHRVRVLAEALADPASGTLSPAELAARDQRVRDVVGGQAPERTTPPAPTGPAPVVVRRAEQPAPPA